MCSHRRMCKRRMMTLLHMTDRENSQNERKGDGKAKQKNTVACSASI